MFYQTSIFSFALCIKIKDFQCSVFKLCLMHLQDLYYQSNFKTFFSYISGIALLGRPTIGYKILRTLSSKKIQNSNVLS